MKFLISACLYLLASCSSAPVVASAVLQTSSEPAAGLVPTFVKSDTNLVVAQGAFSFEGALYFKGSGAPVLAPVSVQAGRLLVIDREAEEREVLEPGAPIPARYAVLFRPGEAEALGVAFRPTVP